MTISNAEILITGGAGFIGSTLAAALVDKGAKVTILDAMISPYGGNEFNVERIKHNIQFVQGDVRNASTVNQLVEGKDIVYHLAGQTGRIISMEDPALDTEINLLGTVNVLDAIRRQKHKPKVVFASSRGVIGKPEYLPVDEEHPTNPRDMYGINKLAAEKACLVMGSYFDFAATTLRLNNVYGPRCQVKSNHYGTINLFISYALQHKVMPLYGDGEQTRDYIYVDDVSDAFLAAIDKKADGETYFVGTGKGTSLLSIVSMIKKEIPDAEDELRSFPENLKSVDFPEFYSSSNKIQKDLGWKAKVSLEEGIKKTIAYYQTNLEHYL